MEHTNFGATDGTPTEEIFAMRPIIVAASAAIALSLTTASSFAQTTTGQAPPRGGSMTESFNRCVDLARARGYAASDLDGNRAAARNFVIRCMQGKQR
jgi:hypothetical protein